jgi:hypothetical protein
VYRKLQDVIKKQKQACPKSRPSYVTQVEIKHPLDGNLALVSEPDPHAFAAAGCRLYIFQPGKFSAGVLAESWRAGYASSKPGHTCRHYQNGGLGGLGKPPCPACGCNCRVSCDGVSSRARRVVGLDKDHFLVGETFRCTCCPVPSAVLPHPSCTRRCTHLAAFW